MEETFQVDRDLVMAQFAEYTSHYNDKDPKIRLKIEHTYRVAGLSQRIARSLSLPEGDVDLAWLIGMLHDIGRFEQLRRFGTFKDADSIDHARFGVELLFQDGLLGKFVPCLKGRNVLSKDSNPAVSILHDAIWNHSAYRIEEGMDSRKEMFCNIIRDADKVDIFKVIDETPLEDVYDFTTEEIKQSRVTPEVFQAFMERHAVLRSLKKTAVDYIVGNMSLAFELVYPESYRITREQGYLANIAAFHSENDFTNEDFETMRESLQEHLQKQMDR